jgi:anhydro-N-acetylmuramic acid kinase
MIVHKAIGLMSGSSIDGLDIAYAEFWQENGKWEYNLLAGETILYPSEWKTILKNIREFPAKELIEVHHKYGKFLGELTAQFIRSHKLKPKLIASHGHTVFHNPEKGYTFQLGYGQEIAAITKITTVSDFRTKDIALGGQGAPLVPIGDELLFGEFAACVNLGGIANMSFNKNGQRVAFDIGPANQLLNYLANRAGYDYDKNGEMAMRGKLIDKLYTDLAEEVFYRKSLPKSLSNEYVAAHFIPLLEKSGGKTEDKLYTVSLHVADQLYKALSFIPAGDKPNLVPVIRNGIAKRGKDVLVTGGGAKNRFLISLLKDITPCNIVVPQENLIDFKEALIFAFMGVLKLKNKINCLSTATGALKNSSTGVVFKP